MYSFYEFYNKEKNIKSFSTDTTNEKTLVISRIIIVNSTCLLTPICFDLHQCLTRTLYDSTYTLIHKIKKILEKQRLVIT